MNNIILIGKHLGKTYGKNTVLQDVSLQVWQGQIYGLIGRNGSGKTTFMVKSNMYAATICSGGSQGG